MIIVKNGCSNMTIIKIIVKKPNQTSL